MANEMLASRAYLLLPGGAPPAVVVERTVNGWQLLVSQGHKLLVDLRAKTLLGLLEQLRVVLT